MDRRPGLSARLKLTISYAALLLLAGAMLLAVVWVFLLRYVPPEAVSLGGPCEPGTGGRCPPNYFIPGRLDLWRAFAPKAAVMMGLLLVLGLGGGWFLAGRMLAPLNQIAGATRIAAKGSLAHRIRMPGPRDEFRELADAFDSMLEQIEAHVGEHQRFAANASHELRTPLATMQTLLEVAQRDPAGCTPELVDRLHFVNARAIDLTEALLMLSRTGRRSFARSPVDLSLVAEEAAETLLPLAEAQDVDIQVSGEVASAAGSPALLLQMTVNLLHNAIVHNRSEDGSVSVAAAVDAGFAVLTVENSGEVLQPHLVATLTEPFQRGTRRVRSDHAGVGLGLAIVENIVKAHDGRLTLTARPEGGLRVEVRLPAAEAP
ncbi:sensor histidine kinase [Glycomyces algeriensis]|uniref:histidine kinase n=1 Tax=Glycomyces algeriensis TaxID=256037 RepID=A0A9W6GAG7_9ACTN|nr:HAMP domain-containing sensor histidine kinase [Glycomyces algeriensis]MDA1364423.1 HAMP domain-containing sensor histidine kinase [Glycomyces algeriensis]MDR7350456.1 two-component system sensor histidine kinase VanS [Glycomyces algeriensis]GLI43163.1 two-component sensor histidine kinase [Glycomyces algeriensis]